MGSLILKKTKFFILFLLLSAVSFAFAKNIKIPELEPLFTFKNDKDAPFTKEDLSGIQIMNLSVIFGLVEGNSEEWMSVQDSFREMAFSIKQYSSEIERSGDRLTELELSEKIMEVMYTEVLSKYSRFQTKVDVMFKTGEYNCVSSSLLFMALAKQCGLDARMQETPVHAFVTVYTKDGKSFDVETTNPFGVNPGVKKAVVSKDTLKVSYAKIPETYYQGRKEISDRKAVTLVAKNLCAFFSEKNDYEKGVPLSIAVYEFVSKEKASVKEDLDKMLVNFAAYANSNYCFSTALDFLEEAVKKYGGSELIQKNYDDVAYNEAAELCNNEDFDSAWKVYENRKYLTEKTSGEIYDMIYESEIANKIYSLMKQAKYLEAAELSRKGLSKIPSSELLKKGLKNSLYNHGVSVHNEAVPLMNNKEYNKALQILQDAQKLNPENSLIKEDINKIKKLLQN